MLCKQYEILLILIDTMVIHVTSLHPLFDQLFGSFPIIENKFDTAVTYL